MSVMRLLYEMTKPTINQTTWLTSLPPTTTRRRRMTTSTRLFQLTEVVVVVLTLLSSMSSTAVSAAGGGAISTSTTVDIQTDGHVQEEQKENQDDETVSDDGADDDRNPHWGHRSRQVPDDCQLVYAPRYEQAIRPDDSSSTSRRNSDNVTDTSNTTASSTHSYNPFLFDPSEWGVFTLVPRMKGTPVYRTYGDIVIQWPDRRRRSRRRDNDNGNAIDSDDVDRNEQFQLMRTWDARETGGQFEGRVHVESVVPGIAMMSPFQAVAPGDTQQNQQQQQQRQHPNVTSSNGNNILPLVPRVDEGGLTRIDSPGAGSITHYHNYTWWFTRDLQAGDEIRPAVTQSPLQSSSSRRPTPPISPYQQDLDKLKMNGYCLDNIRPRKSRVKGAGRGAFATRDISEGSVVAPYLLIPIQRIELLMDDDDDDEVEGVQTHQKYQLLLNYCLSQNNTSDWVYFPYSPMVNLINHYHEPNVKLVLPPAPTLATSTNSVDVDDRKKRVQKPHQHAMLELVATRPIQKGEELYLDYGRTWEDAWWNHVRTWEPYNPDDHYAPAYVIDDTVRLIRTEQEQKGYQGAEYADNVMTTCFYRYSDRSEEERREAQERNTIHGSDSATAKKKKDDKPSVRTFKWEMTKGLFELKNLRPCKILKRVEDSKGRSVYAVRMMNHPSLPSDEQIPGGDHELHLVTNIPRIAIRFSDKPGTTDQHLPNAFRHGIGLPVDIDTSIEPYLVTYPV